jgi:uncharacterized membrane protein
MPYLKTAWDIVIEHPWEWIVVTVFYLYLLMVGIGILFLPNMIRIARKAADQGVPPNVGDLFNFDHFSDDALAVIVQKVAIGLGLCLCFIGSPIIAVLLYWTMHLAADGIYAPIDCLKASFAHAKSNWFHIFLNVTVIWVVVHACAFFTCGVGMLLGVPIMIVAIERFYRSQLSEIIAAADAAGVPRKA